MVNIKREIKMAFVENKNAILISIAILFISLILGYVLELYLHSFLNPVVDDLTNKVRNGVIKLTFESIFLNNIQIVFLMFALGIVFCFSSLILAFNGFFVGYYIASVGDLFKVSLLIIPHGIFEFSSCILACASGFVLFNFLSNFLKNLNNQKNTPAKKKIKISFDLSFNKLKEAFILLLISCILMAIAGFIEVYLTLPIAEFILSIF